MPTTTLLGPPKALLLTILAFALWHCCIRAAENSDAEIDPYIPQLRVVLKNDRTGEPYTAYSFTEDQLARMARTKLDGHRLVAYLENKWSVERLKAYCVETNILSKDQQNLVAFNRPVNTDLHKGAAHGFDEVSVYVSDEDKQETYSSAALAKKFHRWIYSINVHRGGSQWALIEALRNDFMDSSQYDPR
jgi:hypothetical protein